MHNSFRALAAVFILAIGAAAAFADDAVDLSDKQGIVDPSTLKASDPPPTSVSTPPPPPPQVPQNPQAVAGVRD